MLDSLITRRIELSAAIRRAKIQRNAVPHLADSRPCREWRACFTNPHDRSIRRATKELAGIADRIGPTPVFFKIRPLRDADKIERLCRHMIKLTLPLWPDAFPTAPTAKTIGPRWNIPATVAIPPIAPPIKISPRKAKPSRRPSRRSIRLEKLAAFNRRQLPRQYRAAA